MHETCGKCDRGVVGPDKDGGHWSVCACRSKGRAVLGMLCTVCGNVQHFDFGQRVAFYMGTGGVPGHCDEPVELLCFDDDNVQKEKRRSSPRKG